MSKRRISSIIILLMIVVTFIMAPYLGRNNLIVDHKKDGLDEPEPSDTPIPDTYDAWFKGNGSNLNGYTSFFNLTSGNLSINNSYEALSVHRGCVDVPQIPGYNVYAVNVSIHEKQSIALIEKDATGTGTSFTASNDGRVANEENYYNGTAEEFYLPFLCNITKISAYIRSSLSGGSSKAYLQIRNETGTLRPGSPVRSSFTIPSTVNPASWYSEDITNNAPENVTSPGEYYLCINGTEITYNLLDYVIFYKDNNPLGTTKSFRRPWDSGDSSYTSSTSYAYAARIEYLPVDPTDPAKNRTFQLSEVSLNARVNYTAPGEGSSAVLYYDNQSQTITAPWDKSIQNVTLTSNMSCSLQYNLTVFYNRTSAYEFLPSFEVARASSKVSWKLNSTTSVNFTKGIFYNGTLNLTIPVEWEWTFGNAYNRSEEASDYALYPESNRDYGGGTLHVFNIALNGSWGFNFTSPNRLTKIWASSGGNPILDNITVGATVNFTGQFTKDVSDGNLTVATYGPTKELVYGGWNDTFTSGSFVNASNVGWDTTLLRNLGNYSVQLRWNYSGEVGFIEKNFTLVRSGTVVSIIAIDQLADAGYGHYSDTGTIITNEYYGSTNDVVTAYYGASFNVTAQYYDRNNSRGIFDPLPGISIWANLTIPGYVTPLTLVHITDGNYSGQVTTLLAAQDYVAQVKFDDPDAWNATYRSFTLRILPCPVVATIEMWQYGYKNSTNQADPWGPYTGENISIGVQFRNAKSNNVLTSIGQMVIVFGGEVNISAGGWHNGNWFNSTLNASAKAIDVSYVGSVNMTTSNYWFQNVSFTIVLRMTKSALSVVTMSQNGKQLTESQAVRYYWETQDGISMITLTINAMNVKNRALLVGGTVRAYLESTGADIGTINPKGNGEYEIIIDPTNLDRGTAFNIIITFSMPNYQVSNITITIFIVKVGGIPVEVLIAAGAIAAIVATIALIYVGPVKKSKKRRQDELLTTSSAFEDAINLQHILVIYKNTGTCIYFKSFARESIDPDLISGFLSAVSTFGTEMKVEQALDEMRYGDSVLLLNDGELLRVALVLSKSPSSVLRANLGRFTITFEETFREKLVNWRGQLGIFEGADDLVDNLLNASIILPHEVGDLKGMKLVKSPLGRGMLRIAQQMTSGERKFFFLASLVSDSADNLKRPPAELLLAIDQMRKGGVIRPMKMEQFKEKGVSPQELQLIRQQVQQLKISQDQVEGMVQALGKMELAEREAAITSLKQGKQITTDLTAQLGEVKKVTSPDEAGIEVKNLEKKARGFLKEKDFEKAMNSYRVGEILAFQWNLKVEANRFREFQLTLEVDALKTSFAETMKTAKKVEGKDPKEAMETYKKAREIAQLLFKRGFATAEKNVVALTTTIKKMESSTSAGEEVTTALQGTKKDLVTERKELLDQVKALESQEMWSKLQKVYLRLEQISNELYKIGDLAEAKNVKLYRKQAMKYQDIASAIQQDQDDGNKTEKTEK